MSFRIGRTLILRGKEFDVSDAKYKRNLTQDGFKTYKLVDRDYLHLASLRLIYGLNNSSNGNSPIRIPVIPVRNWDEAGTAIFGETKESFNKHWQMLNKLDRSDDTVMLTGFTLKILDPLSRIGKSGYGLIRSGSVFQVFDFCRRWSYGGERSISALAEPQHREDFTKKLSEEFPLVKYRKSNIAVEIISTTFGIKAAAEYYLKSTENIF